MTTFIDRTAIITAQRCPRERFYQRHFMGRGIEKIRKSLPLQFGSAFHAGAEKLLAGDVEGAVLDAGAYIDNLWVHSYVDLEDTPQQGKEVESWAYAHHEQKAMAEALTRGWWAIKGEQFLRDFEILSIEEEGNAELAEGLVLQFRTDALVREKQSGDLYVVSWKTASTFGQYTVEQSNTDMQSMSEVWGVQEGMKEGSITSAGVSVGNYSDIEGVLYLYCVKGKRKLDDYLGFKVQDSPLIYGWVRKGPTPEDDEWFHCYGWKTEELNEKTGKLKGTTLEKGVRKVPIWSDYPGGVKQWIADLAAQRVTPRHINALESLYPQMMPVSRRADEIESWKRQTVAQETRIEENAVKVLAGATRDDIDLMLDTYFPQFTHSCLRYGGKCSMFEICWNPAVKADPLSSGLYQIRLANHPEKEDGE